MILHSLSLTVECIVLGTVEARALGTCESSLERSAAGRRAQLGSKALRSTEHCSLGKHRAAVVVSSIEVVKIVRFGDLGWMRAQATDGNFRRQRHVTIDDDASRS
jgi:hypothetical protein